MSSTTNSSPTISRPSSRRSSNSSILTDQAAPHGRRRSCGQRHFLIRETVIHQVTTKETIEVIHPSSSQRQRQAQSESSAAARRLSADSCSDGIQPGLRHFDMAASSLNVKDSPSRPESIFSESISSEASLFVNSINVRQSEALDDLFNKSKYDLQDNSDRELKENAEQECNVQDKNVTSSHDSTEEICSPIRSSTAYTPSPVESLLLPDDRATETSFPFDESHESSKQKVLVEGEEAEEEVKNGSIPSSSNDSSKKDAAIQAISLENRSSKSSSICNQLVWMLVTLCFLVLLVGVVMSALFETTRDHSKLPPLLQAIYMDYYQPIKSHLQLL